MSARLRGYSPIGEDADFPSRPSKAGAGCTEGNDGCDQEGGGLDSCHVFGLHAFIVLPPRLPRTRDGNTVAELQNEAELHVVLEPHREIRAGETIVKAEVQPSSDIRLLVVEDQQRPSSGNSQKCVQRLQLKPALLVLIRDAADQTVEIAIAILATSSGEIACPILSIRSRPSDAHSG